MKRIESAQNTEYKELQALKQRKNREKTGLFLVEGYHLIEEAIASDWTIRTVYVNERVFAYETEQTAVMRGFAEHLENLGIRMALLTDELFSALSETETPQGVLAAVEWKILSEDISPDARILVLDRIQDPGNLGTLFRTADAAGFDAVWLVKGTVDPLSPKVIRAGQGATFRLPFRFTGSAEETLDLLHKTGKRVLTTSPRNAQNCYDVPMKENFALVIGNEGQGVSEEFLRDADILVKIPMEGETESLNAAVAAAILMFESVRQRTI